MPSEASSILGAQPIRPGDLDGLWAHERYNEIVNRARYLVNDHLEEPPHIKSAREELKSRGIEWRSARENEICKTIDQLSKQPQLDKNIWKRRPMPPPDSDFHQLMSRILVNELAFYGFDSQSAAGRFLYMVRDAKDNVEPESFGGRLKMAGITIDRLVHFTREVVLEGDPQNLSLPLRVENRRQLFVEDLARFLREMQGQRGEVPHATFVLPQRGDDYIDKGILKIDTHTFVLDTTLNSTILQLIMEAELKPAVIMKQLIFWRDGADADAENAKDVGWRDFGVTHWLSQNYDVFSRHPGSGFVTCNPTIYIRKRSSRRSIFKAASSMVGCTK